MITTVRTFRRRLGVASGIAIAVAGCTRGSDRAAAPPAGMPGGVTFTRAQIEHAGVTWGPASIGTARSAMMVPGQVVPNEDRTARLGAPGQGRVLSVRVSPGDRVRTGQVLVTLQSPEAGMAQSDVAKAAAAVSSSRAQATYAASARERAERLLALKAIPRQDYERAVADDELARSALAQANAESRRARGTASALGTAGASASGAITLRAPFGGVVLARTAVPGAVVEAGSPLVVITDPARLWLAINAPEAMAGFFEAGGQLRFQVPAFPGDTFLARIDAIGAGLDPDTRTLPVRATVANPAGRLKPEMLATVALQGGSSTSVVTLPADAVQSVKGTPTVFLAVSDGKGGARFTARAVEAGSRAGDRIAVLHGLGEGDVVVLTGAFAVKAELEKTGMPAMEM